MNAGVDRVIHIDQHHPAILLCKCTDGRKWFLERLRIKEPVCADTGEGKDRMGCSFCIGMVAQGFGQHAHQGIGRHPQGKGTRFPVVDIHRCRS